MTVYYMGLALPLIFAALAAADNRGGIISRERLDSILADLLFVYYYLLTIMRGLTVGTDLPTYLKRFGLISRYGFDYLHVWNERWGFEYGYLFFNKLLSLISTSPRLYVFVTASVILIPTHLAIKKYSRNQCVSYLFYNLFVFWHTSMNLIRLFMALSICLISVKYIAQNKKLKFFGLVLLASLFHMSSILFAGLYFFSRVKLTVRFLIYYFAGCSVLFVFSKTLLPIIMKAFFTLYYDRYGDDFGKGSGTGMILLLIFIFAASYYMLLRAGYFDNRENNGDENGTDDEQPSDGDREDEEAAPSAGTLPIDDIWLYMLLLAIPFNIAGMSLNMAARLMWYFKIGLIFLVPNTAHYFKNNMRTQSDLAVCLGYYAAVFLPPLYYYFSTMKLDNFGVVPYSFL